MSPFNLDDYEPVEDRLRAFWKDHPMGRVSTEIIQRRGDDWIVKASIWRGFEVKSERPGEVPPPGATGFAHEVMTERGVNATSALENCETSAIGRALANLGYAAKGKRPSREEMRKTGGTSTQTPPMTPRTVEASSSPAQSSEVTPRGRDGGERGGDALPDGEAGGAEPPQHSTPASWEATPSAQHDGHEHNWKPSPTMNGWEWCDVKGCGKAQKKRAAVRPIEEVNAP